MNSFQKKSMWQAAGRTFGALSFCLAFLLIIFPIQQQTITASAETPGVTDTAQPAADSGQLAPGRRLIPLGRTTGIKLYSQGTMVVGFSKLDCCGYSPAQKSGLELGDVILALNGEEINSNEELVAELKDLDAPKAAFSVLRDGKEQEIAITAVYDDTLHYYRIGAWIRDSIAGIGTISFVDPDTGNFGALGHGICDTDTGTLVLLDSGSVMESTVEAVVKGKSGTPGQLTGRFNLTENQGVLYSNTAAGIFGHLDSDALYSGAEALEVADRSEIQEGAAEIVSNVSGADCRHYTIRIVKLYGEDPDSQRDMLIEVTDPALLDATGGIVQGMSGSPILQNGKIIGVVTHVLVNDPTRGYGISMDAMLQEMERDGLPH